MTNLKKLPASEITKWGKFRKLQDSEKYMFLQYYTTIYLKNTFCTENLLMTSDWLFAGTFLVADNRVADLLTPRVDITIPHCFSFFYNMRGKFEGPGFVVSMFNIKNGIEWTTVWQAPNSGVYNSNLLSFLCNFLSLRF